MTTSSEHRTHTDPELVDLPADDVLAVDGTGPAETEAFAAAVEALHTALGADAPLQGAWWSGDDRGPLDLDDPEHWRWTLMLPLPHGHAGPGPDSPVRVDHQPAQHVVRVLHHGPYADEGPSLAALYADAAVRGLRPAGPHTEVYLNDPRVTAPAELRTELRLPVA